MHLGERIKEARLEAGLTQRALCGDVITRNMLSQIENGIAKPSMSTLQYLAGRLGKPVGYFWEEQSVLSPNTTLMERARAAYGEKAPQRVLEILEDYAGPDPLFDHEKHYLWALSALAYAESVLPRSPQTAERLLERICRGSIYYTETMEQRRRMLLHRVWQELEQFYQQQEDYKQAYFYARKLRNR